ncbi:MAG: DUF3843 family protein [Muribaculaceae bacterium]|nr:DUF3843 family protein [Muribaculaceae bacterium]
MKDLISEQQFLLRQPCFPKKTPTDRFYFRLCNNLADIRVKESLLPGWSESVVARAILGVVGYFQDIMTDSGVFRSMTEEHHRLYGKWLPFYPTGDDYIPHELNPQDVRFMLWYTLAMNCDENRLCDPMDSEIRRAAEVFHSRLNQLYEDENTPVPEDFNLARNLELNNPEDADEVFHFGHWLFMHCYLMTPAYAMSLAELLASPQFAEGVDTEKLKTVLENAMMEDPTGPLALYIREWLFLIITGRMPREKRQKAADPQAPEHKYFTAVTRFTGGSPIAFFHTYAELNRFFQEALGWESDDNLPMLKDSEYFVVLVNREKGMLVARDVARCIRLDSNPYYDQDYARDNAIDLLIQRGRCPADLLQYLFSHDAIPDARFPGSDDTQLVADNRDFIARCYLQKYYRGD